MSQLDTKALENNFEAWRKDRVPEISKSEAFERYVVEAVLRDFDLSDEEISSGLFGGGEDGGVDGVYFFLNNRLIVENGPKIASPNTASLWLIQAKNANGYQETPVSKMGTYIRV